ncbi:MAG: rhodanese-like domain-containing protein [Thiotrichales bacterium]
MSRFKNLQLAALVFAVSITTLGCAPARDEFTLDAPDALAAAQSGALTLIDIRRPEEWRQTGVATGALRVNMLHPRGPQGFVAEVLARVDGNKDAPIGLICRTGNRTSQIQKLLRQQGFTQVFNIGEGMAGSRFGPGWLARGLPTEPCRAC